MRKKIGAAARPYGVPPLTLTETDETRQRRKSGDIGNGASQRAGKAEKSAASGLIGTIAEAISGAMTARAVGNGMTMAEGMS